MAKIATIITIGPGAEAAADSLYKQRCLRNVCTYLIS